MKNEDLTHLYQVCQEFTGLPFFPCVSFLSGQWVQRRLNWGRRNKLWESRTSWDDLRFTYPPETENIPLSTPMACLFTCTHIAHSFTRPCTNSHSFHKHGITLSLLSSDTAHLGLRKRTFIPETIKGKIQKRPYNRHEVDRSKTQQLHCVQQLWHPWTTGLHSCLSC